MQHGVDLRLEINARGESFQEPSIEPIMAFMTNRSEIT